MARSTTKTLVKQRVINPKTGKPQWVKVKAEKVVNTNTAKGSNTLGKPFKTDAARNKNLDIIEANKTQRAKFANQTAQIADITATASNMTKNITGAYQNSMAQQQQQTTSASPEVAQAVNGGLSSSGNSRDEDDSMDAYVG